MCFRIVCVVLPFPLISYIALLKFKKKSENFNVHVHLVFPEQPHNLKLPLYQFMKDYWILEKIEKQTSNCSRKMKTK